VKGCSAFVCEALHELPHLIETVFVWFGHRPT
jgi:hypothetical protein